MGSGPTENNDLTIGGGVPLQRTPVGIPYDPDTAAPTPSPPPLLGTGVGSPSLDERLPSPFTTEWANPEWIDNPRNPVQHLLAKLHKLDAFQGYDDWVAFNRAAYLSEDLDSAVATIMPHVENTTLFGVAESVPGATEAVARIAQSNPSLIEGGNQSPVGTRLDNQQIMVEVDGQQYPVGFGSVVTPNQSGAGIVRLMVSEEEAQSKFGTALRTHRLVNLSYTGVSGDTQTMSAYLYFGDSTDDQIAIGTKKVGVTPDVLAEAGVDDEAYAQSLIDDARLDISSGRYLNYDSKRPPVIDVPTWVDPSGQLEVKPTFTEDDPYDMFRSYDYPFIQEVQQRMIDAGFAPSSYATGIWDENWAHYAAIAMGASNVLGHQQLLEASQREQLQVQATRLINNQQPLSEEDMKWEVFFEGVDVEGQRRDTYRRKLEPYRPEPVRRLDPLEVERQIDSYSMARLGRKLDGWQKAQVANQLLELSRKAQAVDDQILARADYVQQGALTGEFDLSAEQQELLDTEEFTEVNQALRFDQYFNQAFEEEIAQREAAFARRRQFAADQGQNASMRNTVMGAIRGGLRFGS